MELISVPQPHQRILVVSGSFFRYYFRFLREGVNGKWEFSGFDEVERRNHPARHTLERAGQTAYLRVSGQGFRGSDQDSEYVTVFDLSRKPFDPVYAYHAQGHEDRHGFGVSRRLHSAVRIDSSRSLRHSVDLNLFALDLPVGRLTIAAEYRYDDGTGRFVFESAKLGQTSLTENDFRELASIEEGGPANERLIQLAYEGLKDLAARRTVPDTRERLSFMRLVAKTRPRSGN